MKNISKRFGLIAIAAIMGLSFAAPVHAGGIVDRVLGGGAKSLAKQTLNLTKKAAELEEKAAEIEEKALNLSDRDRRTYQEELVRLGFEAPEGLFNDGPALLSGAPEGTQDERGGILGGLVGLVRGIGGGGGNNSGAVSTPATTGSGILSGRTGAFFSMFDGKNYHMKAKSTIEGREIIVETYTKGNMTASVSETMGMATRTVFRDNMMYVIMDTTRTVMVYPATASTAPEEPIRTTGLVMTGSGTARFDGRNLPYEEYSLSTEEGGVKTQWFLDGNNLAGLRTITSQMTIDMVILALDQNVPNSVFEIPAGYQRVDMQQMMQQMPGGN